MSDGKIYITISDTRTGEVIKGTDIIVPEKKKSNTEENELQNYVMHQFRNLITQQAKNMVNYSLGNIGNFTGDYNAQREVNFSLSALNVGSSIIAGAFAGLKVTGSPVGAIVGAATVATSQAINFGLKLKSEQVALNKQNYNIQQLRQLSGLDGLTNGSRI